MMRQIATTAAGVAGGHLAANAIMGMVSGGKDEEPAPAPQAQGFNLLHIQYSMIVMVIITGRKNVKFAKA